MTLFESILIALVQGLTEFLPVSSSGHMVLVESFMGIRTEGALWEVALHVGTLMAVLTVFRRDIRDAVAGFCGGLARIMGESSAREVWKDNAGFRMGCCILIGTIPVAVVGLTAGKAIEGLFANPMLSAVMIFLTGEILWLSRPHSLARPSGELTLRDGIVVGIAQAGALVPGISRSGITISTGIMRGVDRNRAARFSFMLSIPAILGGAVLKARDLGGLPPEQILPLIAGIAVAGVSGYVALRFLLRIVRAGKLHFFSYYCWAASVISVAVLWSMEYPSQ